jgi:drug/metabolite transporter (DMT)-like permease
MTWNIPLAIAVAIVASLLFAGGSTVQGFAVGEQVGENRLKKRMGLKDLWEVVRAPRWLAGLALAGLGSALNVVGLILAPVTVVQPVGILAVPWSVIFSAKINHLRIPRIKWVAVAQTLVGTVAFILLAATNASSRAEVNPWRVATAFIVVYLAAEGLGFLGTRGRESLRCFFWASGGAFFYGLESALVRTSADLIKQADWLHNPLLLVIAAALVVGSARGGWMLQQAYATGPAETVVGALTVINPVVAVVFGMTVLGEAANIEFWAAFWMVVAAAVAISGVVLLSRVDSVSESGEPLPGSESLSKAEVVTR